MQSQKLWPNIRENQKRRFFLSFRNQNCLRIQYCLVFSLQNKTLSARETVVSPHLSRQGLNFGLGGFEPPTPRPPDELAVFPIFPFFSLLYKELAIFCQYCFSPLFRSLHGFLLTNLLTIIILSLIIQMQLTCPLCNCEDLMRITPAPSHY
jgi:hypothetical protein